MDYYAEVVASILIVPLIILAGASGLSVVASIKEEDAGSAKRWGTVFFMDSFVSAWVFWWLL